MAIQFRRPQTMYSLQACENLIKKYVDRGGEALTVEEGCLGLGLVLLYGEGLKTTVIKEVYLNEWSSGHTIRMYNKCPQKYQKYINNDRQTD